MAESHVEIRTTRHEAGLVVASACGAVVQATAPNLVDGLVKLLVQGAPVLLDVSGLRLEWAPAPEVFVTAVTTAGGWPVARLALFGADQAAAERLRACRVSECVPLARTAEEAAALVDDPADPARPRHRAARPAGLGPAGP